MDFEQLLSVRRGWLVAQALIVGLGASVYHHARLETLTALLTSWPVPDKCILEYDLQLILPSSLHISRYAN